MKQKLKDNIISFLIPFVIIVFGLSLIFTAFTYFPHDDQSYGDTGNQMSANNNNTFFIGFLISGFVIIIGTLFMELKDRTEMDEWRDNNS